MNSFKWICLLFINFIYSAIQSQNIALNKRYTLSTPPNYINSAPASDKTSLTDGIYTNGYFWSQRTTVGWQHVPVTITIDLGEVQPIAAVTFNTVRLDKQFVNFPKNVFVFISTDDKNYSYAGDAADTSDNLPGPYLVKKFSLNNVDTYSRYIALSVIPNGIFLFCDEIEVLKGRETALHKVGLIAKDQLKQAEDSLKKMEFFRENLVQSITRVQKEKSGVEGSKYSGLLKQLMNKNLSESDLVNLRNKAGIEHALNIRHISKSPYTVEMYNPWDSLGEFHEPKENSLNSKRTYYVPVNGVQYGSFILTSSANSSQTFEFKISNANSSLTKFELFDVPYVPSLNYTRIPDPMVPLKGSIRIDPGSTEMFIFKIIGIKRGSAKINITVNSGNKQKIIDIRAQVFNLPNAKDSQNLNANVWAYFTRPIIAGRQEEAIKDLAEHHINTIVIPPAILPGFQTTDYTPLSKYISVFKDVKNILLFMNYGSVQLRNGSPSGQFLSAEWKNKFIEWYKKITSFIGQNGFSNSHIFLYPYDEIYGKDINDFKNLINWVKREIPGIRFYATLTNDAAIETILPLIDVAQVQTTYKGLTSLPPHKGDVWIYSGSGPSRVLSPYGFYRLMSWQAFQNDHKGIGFWNYADEGPDRKLNLISDPLTNPTNSYSVIFDGPGKEIISSRRWEAFRLGIEDYSILKSYAFKFGIKQAKIQINEVLANPSNINKADSVRNKMITEITGIK